MSSNINKDGNDKKDGKRTSSSARESVISLVSLKKELRDFRTKESIASSTPTQDSYPGMYRSDYDYTAERHNPFATNLLEATSYLIKGCLGAGILSMHEGFMFGGIVGSAVAAVAIGLLMIHCMTILVKSAQHMYLVIHVPRLSYPDLAEAAMATGPSRRLRKYSKKFRYLVELLLFLEMCGSCSLYEIMIAKTIKKELEYLSEPVGNLNLPLRAYMYIIMIPLGILCLIRKWKYLAPFSIVADLFIAICIITTMVYSMSEAESFSDLKLWNSIPGLFKFCGICIYTMDGIPMTMPIENNMRSPSHIEFVICCSMSIVFIMSVAAGFVGYWGWGEDCKSPVTIHLPQETITYILQFLLVATLAVTFVIQFWVPFKIIWHYIARSREEEKKYFLERFYRVVLLIFITCVAAVFPQPKNLMIFLGVTFMSLNSLIFPAVIQSLVFWREHKPEGIRWCVVKNFFICVCGVTLFIGGLYSLYFA